MCDKSFGKCVFSFVVGGLTGAVLAMLYAPGEGAQTRENIKNYAKEKKDAAIKKRDEAVSNIKILSSKLADYTLNLIEDGKGMLQSEKEKLSTLIKETKDEIKKESDKLQDAESEEKSV